MTAERLGLRRAMVSVPLFSPGLSRLWVSLFTGAPRALVAPLVQSLRHPMVARDRRLQERAGVPGIPLAEALGRGARARAAARAAPPSRLAPRRRARAVRRMTRPDRRRALGAAARPAERARRALDRRRVPALAPRPPPRSCSRVDVTRARGEGRPAPILCRFRVRFVRRPLIELRFSPERSTLDRPLFYVTGGLLARHDPSHGRLEFREISERGTVLAALHDFVPRLPFARLRRHPGPRPPPRHGAPSPATSAA